MTTRKTKKPDKATNAQSTAVKQSEEVKPTDDEAKQKAARQALWGFIYLL